MNFIKEIYKRSGSSKHDITKILKNSELVNINELNLGNDDIKYLYNILPTSPPELGDSDEDIKNMILKIEYYLKGLNKKDLDDYIFNSNEQIACKIQENKYRFNLFFKDPNKIGSYENYNNQYGKICLSIIVPTILLLMLTYF